MIFGSKAAAFQVLVRSEVIKYHPTLGVEVDRIKPLTAEFGILGAEYDELGDDGDPTGNVYADIRGFYFDSDVQASQKNWSDEEKKIVEDTLMRLCKHQPEYIWLHTAPKPEPPWPTYDECHHNKIPMLALELGFIDQSILYEKDTKNRESVIEKLEELKTTTDSLTVAP